MHSYAVCREILDLDGAILSIREEAGLETDPTIFDAFETYTELLCQLGERDPQKNVDPMAFKQLFDLLTASQKALAKLLQRSHPTNSTATIASTAALRVQMAPGLRQWGLEYTQYRQIIDSAVQEWQDVDSRRSELGHADGIDVDVGLGESLCLQGHSILFDDRDQQEAYRVLSRGIDYMSRSVPRKPMTTPTDVQNMITLGLSYLFRHTTGISVGDSTNDIDTAAALFYSAGLAVDSLNFPSILYVYTFDYWATSLDILIHPSALEAYRRAIDAKSQAPWVGFDVQARYEIRRRLFGLSNFAADAAVYACVTGNPGQAIDFLEKARSTIYMQNMATRSSHAQLSVIDPSLAGKLGKIGRAIEKHSFYPAQDSNHAFSDSQTSSDEQYEEAQKLRNLGYEWDRVVSEIRQLDGQQNFLRVPPVAELCAVATHGPVILLVTSTLRKACYGIVIKRPTVEDICAIELSMTTSEAEELANRFDTTISAHVRRNIDRSNTSQRHVVRPEMIDLDQHEMEICHVLTELWRHVMQPIIQCIKDTKSQHESGNLPHIWICVTGALSTLPLHAAGDYQPGNIEDADCVLNHVICSYTPTLTALLHRPPATNHSQETKAFTLGGGYMLSAVSKETEIVRAILTKQGATAKSLGERASKEEVRTHLRDAHIAHFACHGQQDLNNPLRSRLSFSGNFEIEMVDLMSESLPNARLAVLLACETAQGDKPLAEESLHLAGAMLFAGFRGVVGTLWPMQDRDGPTFCEEFYKALVEGADDGEISYDRAGMALHRAVRKLKESPGVSVLRWAPFVHIGQ
ncbi:unnamed protein product [Rhizoctonia solani]|uniref:CHAT domain-containing protein n=1 Tax=Rhizoctonia solani TaxID=456999 RepID=A0A8H3HRT3_9AGAM|nr:unnamed protein product [Rhizoctonia solani]